MTYRPKKQEFLFFKRCENCHKWGFKWTVKRKPIFVKQINQFIGINTVPKICGRCRAILEEAIKERNI